MDGKRIKNFINAPIEVEVFEIIDSTNAEAKRIAPKLFEKNILTPRLLVAKSQTSGRGRMGRSFLSRADRGIFMTLLYFTDKPLADSVSVTTAAAVIVALEIEKVTGEAMQIKWVNDIYNSRGKVCGILAETLPVGPDTVAVAVGIGINIGEDDFPEELRDIASSIGDIGDRKEELAAGIAEKLLEHSKNPDERGYMTEYRKRVMYLGERVDLLKNGEKYASGIVSGVDDDGGLLLIPDGGNETITISSGEISVRKK